MSNTNQQHFDVVVASKAEQIPEWLTGDVYDETVEFLDSYDGDRAVMCIRFDDDVQVESDGGEPEDNTFARDWHWVDTAIRRAYDLGFKHGTASAS